MTNQEKYKQAFSAIHASNEHYLEVEKMEQRTKWHTCKALIAAAAVCVMVVGSATAAYAMDVGGIQRTLQIWMHGDQTEVTLEFDGDGTYTMDYENDDGTVEHRGGGGIAIGPDGSEIPLSEEELTAQLMYPEVHYEDDGSVWVYWFDQKVEISNRFENGVCYVQLVNGQETLYLTVEYQKGHSSSPHQYLEPTSLG